MDEQDLATLNLREFCGEYEFLAWPYQDLPFDYQDLPFEKVEVDELLEGRSDVPKRAPYERHFHGSSISLGFTDLRC